MRRKDRQLSDKKALAVIDNCRFATLAMTDETGAPYCAAISIARDGNTIYFHCAKAGQKVDILRANPNVCLSCVDQAYTPENGFTVKYSSAVAFGAAAEVADDAEKIHALRLLSERHTPAQMPLFENEIEKALSATMIWRIEIEQFTGKSNIE